MTAQQELERLMSAAADEGFTRERVRSLDELLTNRPELLGDYERWMALLVSLEFEYSLTGQTFVDGAVRGADELRDHEALVSLGEQRSEPPVRGAGPTSVWAYTLVAASVGVILAVYSLFTPSGDGLFTPGGDGDPATGGDGSIAATRPATSSAWPQLRVASLAESSPETLGEVNTPLWLDRFNNYPARGYLVPVPPGMQIEALVDASAEGVNELLILEMNPYGEPLRQATVFSNDAGQHRSESGARRRFGRIGRWTDHNTSSETRYYLFAGLHQLLEDSKHAVWRVSDFAVLINEGGLVHVGWDDSGVTAYPVWPEDVGPPKDDYLVDRDYDDVCASIRVSNPNRVRTDSVRVLPAADAMGELPAVDDRLYKVELPPRSSLVMRFVYGSVQDTKVAVADAETRRIVWRSDNQDIAPSARRRFNADPSGADRNRGALYIENDTNAARRYFVAACYRSSDDSTDNEWSASMHRSLLELPGYTIRGFQGGADDTDCQGLWVTVHELGL